MNLPSALSSIVDGQDDPRGISVVLDECWKCASAYLKVKVRGGRLDPDFFGLPINDLALDCIAELFERDQDGRLIHLIQYFSGLDWREMEIDDLEIALRRIVFSKVNEGLFLRYREVDPSLGRIIRNLKLAAKKHENVDLTARRNEAWIRSRTAGSSKLSAPLAPPALLEAALIPHLRDVGQLSGALDALHTFTCERPWYAAGYPLTAFARIVRTAFIRLETAVPRSEEDDVYSSTTILNAVEQVARDVAIEKYPAYVERGKVAAGTFSLYFDVVRAFLMAEYVTGAGTVQSLYEHVNKHIPLLSEEAYYRRHRNVLEYLIRTTRKRLLEVLRDDHFLAASAA